MERREEQTTESSNPRSPRFILRIKLDLEIIQIKHRGRYVVNAKWMISIYDYHFIVFTATKVGNGTPFQYAYLGTTMDRGAWWATIHGVAKSQTRLSTKHNNKRKYPNSKRLSRYNDIHIQVCLFLCMRACMLSHFSHTQLFATLWTVARRAPLSMGFSRQEIQEWVVMPSSRGSSWLRDRTHLFYLLHWQAGSLSLGPPWKPLSILVLPPTVRRSTLLWPVLTK